MRSSSSFLSMSLKSFDNEMRSLDDEMRSLDDEMRSIVSGITNTLMPMMFPSWKHATFPVKIFSGVLFMQTLRKHIRVVDELKR